MSPTTLIPTTLPPSTTSWSSFITQKLTLKSSIKFKCKATSSSSSITDFDLYDLLGLDRSCNQSEIKAAYRSLQKRCHPDIAGLSGHDMAIILNEAYQLLSDPISRHAYDKEQAKLEELKGYTGKPIYSVWCGPETEERAVFVDEVKCVGCLKCALIAEKTFAIETTFGRARVVAQWADPESKIKEAIDACPVDCISMVERSDLAPLEFLMSKQPREPVRIGAGNTVGKRVSNIFVDVKKFQDKYEESTKRTTRDSSQEMDLQKELRINAIEAIRSISNWLYWKSPYTKPTNSDSKMSLTVIKRKKSVDPNIRKLQDAVAARKLAEKNGKKTKQKGLNYEQDYWSPSIPALSSSPSSDSRVSLIAHPVNYSKKPLKERFRRIESTKKEFRIHKFPVGLAVLAGVLVRYQAAAELDDHVGGSLALTIVNSPWQQMFLAGVTWYFIGTMLVQFVESVRSKQNGQEG